MSNIKLYSLCLHATVSTMIFFTPHANTRPIANAFALGYNSVNISTLYVGYGVMVVLWWALY